MNGGDGRVAAVVITHNRRQEVLCTLGRLTALEERPPLVLVDNGSTDGTAAAVAEQFPHVRIVAAAQNQGAAARTLGVRAVAEPYVALCDDDTWWEPGALRRAADLFDRHPRLAVITGRILIGPENREDPVCRELEQSPLPPEPDLPGYPLLGFLAGASIVRRSAFLEAGGFWPRLFIGGEERWVAAELAARGWGLCYVPDLVVHHHPSPHRDVPARRSYLMRNALWFAWLRRPLPSALRRTVRLLRQLPGDRAAQRGFAAAFLGLPGVLHHRRVVPDSVEYRLRLLESAETAPSA